MPSHVQTVLQRSQPGPQHFELWQDTLAQLAMPVSISCPHVADFTGSLEVCSLGAVSMLLSENSTCTLDRTTAQIRRSDPEALFLFLNIGGPQLVSQERDDLVLRRGDMVLMHSSRTFRVEPERDLPRQRGLMVTSEIDALEIPPADLERLVGRRLDGDDGLGAIVSGYLQTLISEGASLDPADAVRLSWVTLDLLSVMLGRRLQVLSAISPERRDRERFFRICRFIRANLAYPDLTPEAVASAHHISLRTLHRLFRTHAGVGVSGWIRERRLEGYRADLLDPTLRQWSVYRVALRWGLGDASHVSRAFKAAYGLSPAAYRAEHSGEVDQ